ncbi:MAG: hypothetical protein IT176_03650 [Acidobacteria bacterium]|nr:hypothetical protein [Acidobacteriota bacterium]
MTAPRTPARLVPLLYLGTAHTSLALAFLLVGLWPRSVAGFFYHAWMVGLVHLVTLGWITFSILGAIYIVGPIALRMEMPQRRIDVVMYVCAITGLIGMVGHFWIERYAGMAWSAGIVATAVLYMTWRIGAGILRAPVQPAVKLHIVLACANFWIAATMGLLVAWNKTSHALPGFVLSNVFAHAHLAALGWATMMVIGVAYRLLPMTLPSKILAGRPAVAGGVLLEVGVLGLFVSLLRRSSWAFVFGALFIAGVAVFAAHVVWMAKHPAARQPGMPRPDFGVLHAAAAGVWLVAAAAAGLVLAVAAPSVRMLHLAAAYGVAGLVGFLAQIVVGMEGRLVPLVTWFWSYADSGYRIPPPSPHTMRDRTLQTIVFAGWTAGVPALAAGMYLESAGLVAAGAWSLFAGVTIAALDNGLVVAAHWRRNVSQTRATA